ncbi:reticulophagy regulator 2 [Hyla sarda]|uniref:reticulophagy regulator 2 n=1 Tax=Hyla sarda TaxID=327740 RepID=UPI0024C41797|nr:reticulophagy regulator 2 [Hyla sarda]XP_056392767.1 reticulophagy regulator 2 [Hyla sarda]
MSGAAEPKKMAAREEVAAWSSGDLSQASEEDMRSLEASLQQQLSEWGPLLMAGQRLLVWERPLPSLLTAAALHGTFWLFSYLSLRPVFLLSFFLLCLLGVERWKPWLLRHCRVQPRGDPSTESEASVGGSGHHRLLSLPELCHCLAETWFTSQQYVQELLLYKKQNPGKFCAMVCSCCAVLAVVGHYVPGIMISYIILLSVLLWPLVVYRELIQKMYTALEPVLMKLDYSMKGEDLPRSHKIRQTKKEPEEGQEVTADTDSESEIELSGFSPEMDVRLTALALSITDSELSDEEASILESGGFSVSRATTPQLTDVSEDLDQPVAVSEDPPPADPRDQSPLWLRHRDEEEKPSPPSEMPLLPAEQLALNPEELLPTLTSPLHFVNTHFNGKGQPPNQEGESRTLSQEAGGSSSAITAAVQSPSAPLSNLDLSPPETVEPPGADGEDFELVEQGELDLMRKELEEAEKLYTSSTSHQQSPDS